MGLTANAKPVNITILSGASLSDVADIRGVQLVSIIMPAAWTAADLSFQSSEDNVTFNDVYDEYDVETFFNAGASRFIGLKDNLNILIGANYLKVRSGSTSAAVNQGADRVITLLVRPLK